MRGELLRVKADGLLFDAARGMNPHECRVFPIFLEVIGKMKMRGDLHTSVLKGDVFGHDICLCDATPVSQSE
jgi:hypothetical protein